MPFGAFVMAETERNEPSDLGANGVLSDLSELRKTFSESFVHLPGFVFCFAGIVLITKLSSLLSPFNLYFTFSELVTSGEGGYGLLPFLVKMAIPFSVGALYFYRYQARDMFTLSDQPDALRPINLELTAMSGAGMGALMLSWPAIVGWEFIVSETVYKYRAQFVIVYILYVVSFALVARAGVLAARIVATKGETSSEEIKGRLSLQYQFINLTWWMLMALATGGIADWASKNVTSI